MNEHGVESGAPVVHLAPPIGTGILPCCGKTPFEAPEADRMTVRRDQVTCQTEAGAARAALAAAWFDGYSKGNLDGYFGTREEREKSPYADLDPVPRDRAHSTPGVRMTDEFDAAPFEWTCPGCGWHTRDTRLEQHPCPRVTPPAKTDRGCTHLSSLPLIGLAFVALALWGYVTGLQPWQWVAFGVCAAFAFICVGCCGDGSVRDRLDAEAPKVAVADIWERGAELAVRADWEREQYQDAKRWDA